MTFIGLEWANTGATDIHLLRNLVGPELKLLLRVFDDQIAPEGKPLAEFPGLTAVFTERLNGPGGTHGADVDHSTGAVSVTTAAMAGRSFVITASVTLGGVTRTTRIRVNIHNALTRMWLAPAPHLTVRRGATGVRFSVLALFDDGVIGDITHWSPFEKPGALHTYVHHTGVNAPALTWSSSGPPVAVDPETGVLTPSADSGESTVTARFETKAPATAIAVCALPWSTSVPLTRVGGPGAAAADSVPNILFLPDGFTDAEFGQYESIVRLVVKRLEYRNRTRPFAALVGRMNYWRGWVPSREPGVSVLNEVDVNGFGNGVPRADGVPHASDSLPKDRWEIEDLVNAVGLPTVQFDPLSSALEAKLAEWQGLYGTAVTRELVSRGPDKAGGPSLFQQWLALNDRVLIDERDTAFHASFGNRPALVGDNVDHAVSLNPRRLTDTDFNAFLDALRGPGNEILGPLWTVGKDRDLVVMVCHSSHGGGSTRVRKVRQIGPSLPDLDAHLVGVSLAARHYHQLKISTTGGGFELVPDKIPTDVFYSVWLTVTHELGHAAGLGDEAGGAKGAPSPDEIADAAERPNVQDAAALGSGATFDVGKIKWAKWPRIAKAGVVRTIAPPPGTPAGPTVLALTVTLEDVKRSGLAKGDLVRLRRRPLATAGEPSPAWRVDSVDVAQGRVVIVPQNAGPTEAVDPAAFPAGSILLAPVRAPGALGAELTLAGVDALERIRLTRNPLNANPLRGEAKAPNDDAGRPAPDEELTVPTAATNFPGRAAPKPPADSSWTIGLFENGGRRNTGFYRPTGICLMSTTSRTNPDKSVFIYDLCLVCRYAFIDRIDPTRHGQVEQDFVERYGKQGAR